MNHIANFRAVEGIDVSGGRIDDGLLFRSAPLADASRNDLHKLTALGIKTIVDLRSPRDAGGSKANRVPSGAEVVSLPVSGEHPGWRALAKRDLPGIWTNVAAPGAANRLMRDTYRSHALDFDSTFGEVIRLAADTDRLPILIHCRQGKDRTGWAIALILEALGAGRPDIVRDYMRSNESAPTIIGGPLLRGATKPLVTVDGSYLRAAYDAVGDRDGSVDEHLTAIGVNGSVRAALTAALVTTSKAS